MSDGKAIEVGHPNLLLQNPDSEFSKHVNANNWKLKKDKNVLNIEIIIFCVCFRWEINLLYDDERINYTNFGVIFYFLCLSFITNFSILLIEILSTIVKYFFVSRSISWAYKST